MIRRLVAAYVAELRPAAESAVLPGAVCSGFLLTLWAVWFTPLAGWLS